VKLQVPSRPATAQLWQVDEQALSQQKPSMQGPPPQIDAAVIGVQAHPCPRHSPPSDAPVSADGCVSSSAS
jgi:hypothetical protein